MNSTMRRAFSLAAISLLLAGPASARNTFHDFDAAKAKAEGVGRENLLDVPVYLAGERHAAEAQDLGVFRTNMRTNAANKSDEEACQIAFLSALISLQNRARALGGDAVVDVRSITKNNDLTSATQYRCVAGAFVANVALEGRVVKLAK